MPDRSPWIVSLYPDHTPTEPAGLRIAGGKGASLQQLARAAFPVPEGFVLTTQAYRDFVQENSLEGSILAALPGEAGADLATLELASHRIREFFSAGKIPAELVAAIRESYERLGELPVAVRSSATAEDLPGLSFAGQQETYLNVLGVENLLQAVTGCWSSLWTARAIGYRLANKVPPEDLALAVVVQVMVDSEASGVLFTADPLTGLRTATVIDAAYGLGEAIVSGQVEPDHYVVDPLTARILSKTLGAKTVSLHSQEGGGLQRVEAERQVEQALPDEQILALADLGQKAAALFGSPQDIEWAWAGGKIYILQSRPVTSLYPLPKNLPVEPLKVMFSFGAVQGLLDPITPLGRDAIQTLFATGEGIFGYRVTAESQQVLLTAGERLWGNITQLIRNSFGRRVSDAALNYVEPGVRQAVESLWSDPRLQPESGGFRLSTAFRLARFFLPVAGNLLLNLVSPIRRREIILQESERLLAEVDQICADLPVERHARLAELAGLFPRFIGKHLPRLFVLFVSGVASGMASFAVVRQLAKGLSEETMGLALELTRGLPHNPTTEMDLVMWETAQEIRRNPAALTAFQTTPAQELGAQFQAGKLPASIQASLQKFFEKYGGRGLGEIDLGRPRWQEEPAHVFSILSGYLKIDDLEQAPDTIFARGKQSALAASQELAARLRKTRFGWLKSRLARFFSGRMRELMGMRESPKFFIVRLMALLRRELLKVGEEFAKSGELEHQDDLFYLTFTEQKAFAVGEPPGEMGWKGLIASRREAYQQELLRRQIPRLLLSDGRAFYSGLVAQGDSAVLLSGSPVSPGAVTGKVRIVLDPRQAGLLPGEIMVCPGTDPSWTPLFLTASGLIMEVGGMMTHGAVVAREYGIPAVVGVDQATTRLQTGQMVSLDGSTGAIRIL